MATSPRPDDARTTRRSGSRGTRSLYSFHLIAGLGVLRLTFGGIVPVSKMEQTLHRDAKNAVISRWLQTAVVEYPAKRHSVNYSPDVALETADDELVIPAELLRDPVRLRRVSHCSPRCVQLYEIHLARVTPSLSERAYHRILLRGRHRRIDRGEGSTRVYACTKDLQGQCKLPTKRAAIAPKHQS